MSARADNTNVESKDYNSCVDTLPDMAGELRSREARTPTLEAHISPALPGRSCALSAERGAP